MGFKPGVLRCERLLIFSHLLEGESTDSPVVTTNLHIHKLKRNICIYTDDTGLTGRCKVLCTNEKCLKAADNVMQRYDIMVYQNCTQIYHLTSKLQPFFF